MTSRLVLPMLVSLVLAGSGCGGSVTPTAPTSTDPTTFSFSSSFATNGSASRSFEQIIAGAVTVTLSAVSPDLRLGVGLGIPRSDGVGCNLTRAVETGAGGSPQITTSADAGVWCVRVWDVGQITDRVSFTVGVTHY